jgi:rare lipoprotein A (peptidoglycan hydrolase)
MRSFLPPGSLPTLPALCCLAVAASLSASIFGCSGQTSNRRLQPLAEQPLDTDEAGRPQVTVASWYGPGFHGRPTSSGEIFNQHAMTAASRTLPLGSHARVTNMQTGKSVVVRINDRGPFVRGRGIDLSRAAARRLGIDHRGTATVRVSRIDGPSGEVGDSWAGKVNMRESQVTSVDYSRTNNPPVAESSMIPSSLGSWFMELVSPPR